MRAIATILHVCVCVCRMVSVGEMNMVITVISHPLQSHPQYVFIHSLFSSLPSPFTDSPTPSNIYIYIYYYKLNVL